MVATSWMMDQIVVRVLPAAGGGGLEPGGQHFCLKVDDIENRN
jgi:hypothetical protein